MIPPKRLTFFSPWLGDAQKVYACSKFSLNKQLHSMYIQYCKLLLPNYYYETYAPGMTLGTYSTAVTHKYIHMSVLVLLYISYELPVFIMSNLGGFILNYQRQNLY